MTAEILLILPEGPREHTASLLRDHNHDVAVSASVATISHAPNSVQCVITGRDLPDGDVADVISAVREHIPDAACIIYTDGQPPTEDLNGDNVAEFVDRSGAEAEELLLRLVEHSLTAAPQAAYPLPDNEAERVAAVQRYRSVPGEADVSLDRLAELASALFDVPMAGIGLIEEHGQSFRTCYGIDIGTVPREETICTYAILEPDVTVIEDTTEDPRFADNETLSDAEIRFYASANLTAPDGAVIGTFCLYDNQPRGLSPDERHHLVMFGEEAMEKLELGRRVREAGVRA